MQALAPRAAGHPAAVASSSCPPTGPSRASPYAPGPRFFQSEVGASRRQRVACGGGPQTSRFRVDFDPSGSNGDASGSLTGANTSGFPYSPSPARPSAYNEGEESNEVSMSGQPWDSAAARGSEAGSVTIANAYAQAARVTPITPPGASFNPPVGGREEFFKVDMHRNYSAEWPSVEPGPSGSILFRRGFLDAWDDPDAPFYFVYSGVEHFTYSLPERAAQTAVTALFAGLYAAAFAALYAWVPGVAAAALFSWLAHRLSASKCALLLVLGATGKLWIFWALEAGRVVDSYLSRAAPNVSKTAWFWFKAWLAFCLLSTPLTPPLPFGPFMPSSSPFDYPFKIFHM